MIVFNNWQISVTGLIARQYDNLSRRIDVEGDLPAGYTWQLLVQSGGNADTILLEATEKGAGAVLTADNLSRSGEYYIQLRGVLEADGVTRRHTNVVSAYIPESLTGIGIWPAVPTEFAQVEARILELYQHPPIPGSNGYWLVWDTDKNEYVESQLALPEAAAGGLTTAQINALDGMFKVCAFTKADVSAEYTEFKTAFGIADSGDGGETEVTLTSISATYDGGDVAVGTAVADLTGLVVTAHYSDGTSQAVTGYTLSGTIAEGSNTVTVTYQGKTATFTVTGVAESSGGGESGETGVSNESTWTDGVAYTFNPVKDTYIESNGAETAYNNWSSSPYLYCDGASQLVFTVLLDSSMLSNNNDYNAFYDENKAFISKFSIDGIRNASIDGAEIGATEEITIPENAAYFRVSHKTGVYGNIASVGPIISITPKA